MKLPEHLRWTNTPSQIVGSVVRRRRKQAGITLERFSQEAKRHGLKWSAGRVSDFEAGRVELTLATLVTVAQVLANVTDEPVVLADLLDTEGGVDILGRTVFDVASMLRGVPVQPINEQHSTPTEIARRNGYRTLDNAAAALEVPKAKVVTLLLAQENAGLVDRRAARALGVPLVELTRQSVLLWGRGFSAERDRRAGPAGYEHEGGRNTAQIGEITRALRDELRPRLNARQGSTEGDATHGQR